MTHNSSDAQGRPNWVEARADCTLEDTFEQLIAVVWQDTECFNQLPHEKRSGRGRVTFRKHDGRTVYVGYGDSERLMTSEHIRLIMTGSKLEVRNHQDKLMFTVDREWNPKTLICDLLIDGEIHSLWQISQKAVGDLLFP